jgi:thiol:disulfide interchange protein DsbD
MILLLSALWLTGIANAQMVNPVHWSFKAEMTSANEAVLTFTANIDDNFHLYAQDIPKGGPVPTSFHFEPSDAYALAGKMEEVSEGEDIFDSSFNMKLKVFSRQAIFKQKVKLLKEGPVKITGTLEFMCCDNTRCIPPQEKEFSFQLQGGNAGATSQATASDQNTDESRATKKEAKSNVPQLQGQVDLKVSPTTVAPAGAAASTGSAPEEGGAEKGNKPMLVFFLLSLLAGLAGTLTPCVFPMIPMTIAFFSRNSGNRARAILQAFIFGASIMLIYTSVGLIVSLTSAGANLGTLLSTHWLPNLLFFILFLVFAAAFLGMFELVLPNSLITKADQQVDKGGMLAAFFMGLTTVLVSFSCTGPLVGALLVEAAAGEVIKPTIGMFGFGLGFALPFTLLAIFPSWLKNLPKSGGWLNSVEVVLGFLVLALSMKYLSNIDQTYSLHLMSRDLYLSIWIVIFSLMGFYLLGKIKFKKDSDLPYISFPRLVLVIIVFSFVVYLIPGLFGAPLKPISGLLPPMSSQSFTLSSGPAVTTLTSEEGVPEGLCDTPKYADKLEMPPGLSTYFDYKQALSCARKQNKPLLLDFVGHACSNCKEMETTVFTDPEVIRLLKNNFVIVKLYVDDRTKLPEADWVTSNVDGKVKKKIGQVNASLQIDRYKTNTQPYYVIINNDEKTLGKPLGHTLDKQEFIKFLRKGINDYNKKK